MEDLLHRRGVAELIAVRAEGVGVYDLRARLQIGAVHRRDLFGRGQVEGLGRVPGGQAGVLEHGAHRAVKNREFHAFNLLLRLAPGRGMRYNAAREREIFLWRKDI